MPRKRLPPDEKKENITFRLPVWMIKSIKLIPGYNVFIEEILTKYIKRKD